MPNKFELGQLVATRGVARAMKSNASFHSFVSASLKEYTNCNWGDVPQEDKEMNDLSVQSDGRLLGSYKHPEVGTLWIITEWDRSVTTLLFPDEY